MKAWAFFLAVGALLPLLAGCSGPRPAEPLPVASTVAAGQLVNGTFYAFRHGGGDLEVAMAGNGSADLVLFGADDERLGHIGVGAERARGRFVLEGVEAGELVLQAIALNGTLDLRSDGSRVQAFRALPVHLERHPLVQRGSSSPIQGLPGMGGDFVDETVEIELLRPPVEIIAIARATFDSFDLVVTGGSGTVYQVAMGGSPLNAGFVSYNSELPGEDTPENMRGRFLSAHVQAAGYEGVVILEARSYSRAARAEGVAYLTDDVPRFTYGLLPDQPVSFEVRAGTEVLYLWQEDPPSPEEVADACDEAGTPSADCRAPGDVHVALFGPADERVATVAVPANRTLAVPVHASGTWVAVRLDGEATLGADRVPGDFELHPLDTQETTAPAQAAGGDDGTYGNHRQGLDEAGVAFRVAPANIDGVGTNALPNDPMSGSFLVGCEPSSVTLLLRGETLGAWGFGFDRSPRPDLAPIDPSLLLGDGELEVAYDDFGRGCDRVGVTVTGYLR